ncbi:hypothetical protein SNE40_002085 [Patella caerulea]|uniref:Roc domain-containing protein n=1 Tax=Patella caerulea TaxID=87958 RepID=A0AAN8PZH6_PATCE
MSSHPPRSKGSPAQNRRGSQAPSPNKSPPRRSSKTPSPTRIYNQSPIRVTSAKSQDGSTKSRNGSTKSRSGSAGKRIGSGKLQSLKRSGSASPLPPILDRKSKKPIGKDQGELTEKGMKIVDMSGQGMTSIPVTVTATRDIGELCLASNNLRILPADIQKLVNLEKLDISKNGLRCVNPEDFSGIPTEFTKLTQLQELKISECNLPFIPPAIWTLCNLKVLDVSRNKINMLLPEVGNLVALQKLNLQQTNITSLPQEIAYCQELEEILLWGNSIESLPETLPEMPKLRKLAINYRSFCSVVDSYMENLLRKGQIRSEHIPNVVFELPALECLDLESTKINHLPDIYNVNLQEFYVSKNFLQNVPDTIYNLKHLRVIDLSHNLIMKIPDDLGQLRSLTFLKLNNNLFEKVPVAIGKLSNLETLDMSNNRIRHLPPEIRSLCRLHTLLLENNNLQALPDSICELTRLETLDVTNNSLKHLPMKLYMLSNLTVAHSYRKLHKRGLWLYQNPLETPPPEIWRTDKPDQIYDFLKKQHIIKIDNLQRQKILMFGESQCGKTSLAYTLVQNKSFLTREKVDKTRVLKQLLWRTDNKVEFLINDFGGDKVYKITYPLFTDSKSLVFVVYDSSTFHEKNYHDMIGKWIDMLVCNAPGTVVKIIGTKSDLDPYTMNYEPQKESIISLVQKQLSVYYKNLTDELNVVERDVELIQAAQSSVDNLRTDAEDAILKLLQVRQRKLIELRSCQLRINPKISIVSSSDGISGIPELISDVEFLVIDKTLFPNAQCKIPEKWEKFKAQLKRHKSTYLLWDKVEEIAENNKISSEEMESCIQHFHDIGDIIWFSDVPGLSEILFQRPRELFNLLGTLFRHDMDDFLNFETCKLFRSRGNFTAEEFVEVRERFLLCGQISRPLLNCFLFYQNVDQNLMSDLLELLPLLDLCYTIPEPESPSGHLFSLPLMVLPWYNTDTELNEIADVWPEKPPNNEKEASVIYSFPFHGTDTIFEKCVSTIQDLVLTRMDWKCAVFATTEDESVLLREGVDIQSCPIIKLTVRGTDFSSILELLTDLVQVINTLLIRHPGIYWKIDFPMKNIDFLSKVTSMPDVKFENTDHMLTAVTS